MKGKLSRFFHIIRIGPDWCPWSKDRCYQIARSRGMLGATAWDLYEKTPVEGNPVIWLPAVFERWPKILRWIIAFKAKVPVAHIKEPGQ